MAAPQPPSHRSAGPDGREPPAPAKKPRKPRKPKGVGTPPREKPGATKAVASPPQPAPFRDWPLRQTAIVAGITLAVDQLSKWLVVQQLDLSTRRELDVIDPFLNLRMAWNEGVNFGLLASGAEVMRWVLVLIALAVCAWVLTWIHRTRPGRFARIAAGLLVGGALGNVIDRLTYGAVADFLNMSLPGWTNPYSFNVADIAIFAGAIGLVIQPTPETVHRDKPRDGRGKTR